MAHAYHNVTQLMRCVELHELYIQIEALGFWHPEVLFSNPFRDP